MSSLSQLFARVRSSLMGVLHTIDESISPHKQIIHLQCETHEECTAATDSLSESLGHHHIIVLVASTPEDPRAMLCIRATQKSLEDAIGQLPRSVIVSYEPLSEARHELVERRLHCLL